MNQSVASAALVSTRFSKSQRENVFSFRCFLIRKIDKAVLTLTAKERLRDCSQQQQQAASSLALESQSGAINQASAAPLSSCPIVSLEKRAGSVVATFALAVNVSVVATRRDEKREMIRQASNSNKKQDCSNKSGHVQRIPVVLVSR